MAWLLCMLGSLAPAARPGIGEITQLWAQSAPPRDAWPPATWQPRCATPNRPRSRPRDRTTPRRGSSWWLGAALTAAGNPERAVPVMLDAFGGPQLTGVLPADRPAAAADLIDAQLALGDVAAAEPCSRTPRPP